MKRMTSRIGDRVIVAESDIQEALRRLSVFVDVYEDLMKSVATIPMELENLKAAGKEKTVRYRELFGQKLMNNQFVALFKRHGIGD